MVLGPVKLRFDLPESYPDSKAAKLQNHVGSEAFSDDIVGGGEEGSSTRRAGGAGPTGLSAKQGVISPGERPGITAHWRNISISSVAASCDGLIAVFLTFKDLLTLMPIDILLGLQVHCKDCALVTSSGQLIGSRRGAEIDRAECVIRMNDAPTWGYQEDVGRRTSLRVVAHSSIQRLLQKGSELLNASQDPAFIFWGPSSCMRKDGKGRLYNHLQLIHRIQPKLRLHTITRQKMLHFDELFKRETGKDRKTSNSWLSTGWFTMIIALELCDRIDVYGMVPPNRCRDPARRSVPYHYYEPMGIDECTMYISHELGRKGSHHRFITEKHVFARWARKYSIRFHQPEWEPESVASNHTESEARRR
ncbi:alpha-N-acetylgalactosaminide alpha-2,6-sialyltransferase 5 [Carcharodon carcharias]|uniref:alpha-N-acetylgalactosaminide alpha-2,6-sialyltransferase 5 n=1 Tax=Carcharodon carcharias TaxID=13397 RepID=UPI001B7EE34B|nr:alpha-N-acetylgalactosaminide alpha-2,6-sialyltransferase 5 [Carcharodon carcharias]